jgi:23S rRNA pseudouridine2604 synthase
MQHLNVDFFPLGRLDKESEGLMILTNDGSIYREVTSSKVDKEYIVEVNDMLTNEVILKLSNGIEIMGVKTKPAIVELIDTFNFRIILRQGLNRQIRRMCYKLGYNVLSLKRIRIGNVFLGNLVPNAKREIYKNDLLITNS